MIFIEKKNKNSLKIDKNSLKIEIFLVNIEGKQIRGFVFPVYQQWGKLEK